MDNPLLTLNDRQRIAEDKAKRELLVILQRERKQTEQEEARRKKQKDDLKLWYKDIETDKQTRKKQEEMRTQIEKLSIQNQQHELESSAQRTRRLR